MIFRNLAFLLNFKEISLFIFPQIPPIRNLHFFHPLHPIPKIHNHPNQILDFPHRSIPPRKNLLISRPSTNQYRIYIYYQNID